MLKSRILDADLLSAVGLAQVEIENWLQFIPIFTDLKMNENDFINYKDVTTHFLSRGEALLAQLQNCNHGERAKQVVEQIKYQLREVRRKFMNAFVEDVYKDLTNNYATPLRVDELLYKAAKLYPGLVPEWETVQQELTKNLKDKEGHEVDQSIFLYHVLANHRVGNHLIYSMSRPKEDSIKLLDDFKEKGQIELEKAVVIRKGKAGHVYLRNTKYLNAEDDSTNEALETAVDLILLDPEIKIGVLRGDKVTHRLYEGKHVFNAGINLTLLYHGKIAYLYYIFRELGFLNKIYRGLSTHEYNEADIENNLEKPWIGAVESFAIGAGCQNLLVLDYVLAENNSYFTLPARKEGIIPGVSNLRLPRFTSLRVARQGILFDRKFTANSPEGQMLCDELVEIGEMDEAIDNAVASMTDSGVVSFSANRKALRVGSEPLEVFRQYMALYAREQAECHFSSQLIHNLEFHWNAANRTP